MIITLSFLLANTAFGGSMAPQLVTKESFSIVGIETRTNNAAEFGPNGKIGKLWERFYKDHVLEQVPNKNRPGEILAVYTNYESDHHGDYTLIIGASVSSVEKVPEGMVVRTIPEQSYAKFHSGKGKMPGIVVETWKRIYGQRADQPGGDRSYTFDFEVYDNRAQDPTNSEVDIYIATKK
jgi:predicted transcriptional regulator YdeE